MHPEVPTPPAGSTRLWLTRLFVGAAVATAIFSIGLWAVSFRATSLINTLLRDYATAQTARLSDSSYVLSVGRLHFNWPRRRVTLDSIALRTDTVRNAARTDPMPATTVTLRNCTMGGIDVTRLVLSKGLTASHFGCRQVAFSAEQPLRTRRAGVPAPRPAPGDSLAAAGGPTGFLTLQGQLALPTHIPAVRVGRIALPNVTILLRQRQAGGDMLEFRLHRARLRIEDVAIDPRLPATARRPLFSRSVILSAESTTFRPDSVTRLHVGALDVSLTDSTIQVRDFVAGPQLSDAAFARLSPWRRDRIRLGAVRVTVRGADFGAFSREGTLAARLIVLDSARFGIRSDKRKPRRPGPPAVRRSPQAFMAAVPRRIAVDSLRVIAGEVVYEEFAPGHASPGRLVIGRLYATAASLRHTPALRTTEQPLVVNATGFLMNRTRFNVRFEVPLDAGSFELSSRGAVAAMPITALNPLVSHILPTQIKSGELLGLTYAFHVTDGRARGEITPFYQGLSVDITGRGMGGPLRSGGIIRGALRGVAEFAANQFMVRGSNPDRPDRPPRIGLIDHQFDGESLPAFYWSTVKSGLLPLVRR